MPSLDAQMLLKAAATATDQGSFTAIAAAYTLDRDKEFIRPGAFANTIKAWQDRDRPIPLHWAHKGGPENVIGSVDPQTMSETDAGLYVEGTLDLENSDLANEAWRLVKADTVSLSFGFLAEVTPRAKDGTREIVDIDLYEISLTPAPANPDTHFLSLKAMATEEQLRERSAEVERDLIRETLPEAAPEPDEPQEHKVKRLLSELQDQLREAGSKRFAADEETYVYVEDLDVQASWAVFCISGGQPYTERHMKVAFVQGEREVVLATEETEVERVTQFRPKGAPEAWEKDATDKEPQARSVDPLHSRSMQAVLEIQSDGVSLRKPPKVKQEPKPEPPDEADLRRRSREVMLELLTGATHDTE